ncbi:hypothetical protein TcWFU_003550 [Taenia crassiceps]|uniref:Uncharacterized protein n=1 Tax=Taenia crassiceps TaxID=6207 RepID=A0ABR4QGI4_9CEST
MPPHNLSVRTHEVHFKWTNKRPSESGLAYSRRSSKVVITPEAPKTTPDESEGTITQLKEAGENVNGESIPPIDGTASTNEQNGDCSTVNAASTTPAVDESKGSKSAHKKKLRRRKRPLMKKKLTQLRNRTSLSPEPVQEEKGEEHPTGNAEAQSEEIPTVDQGTTIPETTAESSDEPLVEIAPSLNGLQDNIGEEQFLEEPEVFMKREKENTTSISEKSEEESKMDGGVAEKLANLGIDPAQSLQSNNVDVHVNGDTAVEES